MPSPESTRKILDRLGIDYVVRPVKNYPGSGPRVNIPAEWVSEGHGAEVILIREAIEPAKIMAGLINELDDNIAACTKFRGIDAGLKATQCHLVTDQIYKASKRNNDVCKKCPIGIRIAELSESVAKMYSLAPVQDRVKKIAANYKEEEA